MSGLLSNTDIMVFVTDLIICYCLACYNKKSDANQSKLFSYSQLLVVGFCTAKNGWSFC